MFKIMVTDHIHEKALSLLEQAGDAEIHTCPGCKKEDILSRIHAFDAIITRSGTDVDEELLEKGTKLKVVGRAGVGVDNIDLLAATKKGVVILNAPEGNTLAAAELTMGMIFSVMRLIPLANESVRKGEWKRSKFMGEQIKGKTILVVGFGRVGSRVGESCKALGMEVLCYDPYIPREVAEQKGAKYMENLETALMKANILTMHTPLNNETKGMIGERELYMLPKGSYVINCARGGIVSEDVIVKMIRNGHIARAACDVFTQEPVTSTNPLMAEDLRDKIILTPHIGANTFDAQYRVSSHIVRNVLAVLRGEEYDDAVNIPFLLHKLTSQEKLFLDLAGKMGKIASTIMGASKRLTINCRGELFWERERKPSTNPSFNYTPFTIATVKGAMEPHVGVDVTYMTAPLIASDRGLKINETVTKTSLVYNNIVEILLEGDSETISITGTVTEEGKQRIVGINGYQVDFVPHGVILIINNKDRPGVIGFIGTLMGENSVNIANFSLGRKEDGTALGVMELDEPVSPEVEKALSSYEALQWYVHVNLNGKR